MAAANRRFPLAEWNSEPEAERRRAMHAHAWRPWLPVLFHVTERKGFRAVHPAVPLAETFDMAPHRRGMRFEANKGGTTTSSSLRRGGLFYWD
ncbi:MAG: hypothetical protein C6P35_14265 [Cohnella sp.]|nr:MAG: hypothetical protein C6P35_14265 [Cohnella sp.]